MAASNSSSGSSSSEMMYPFITSDEPVSKRGKLEAGSGKKQTRKTNRDTGKPNPLISPTEKCKVCLEPAAKHIHYGAVTCFSCRAFFRRSIQNHSSDNYKCRKEGHCDITLKARKSCQRCRFERCVEVGMKSSWVLSEEERYHRFRKQRERNKQPENGELTHPHHDHKDTYLTKEEIDHEDHYNNHHHNSQSDEDDHHRDSSPGSSQGYGGIDSDTERSFHQYGHSLSPHYVSLPSLSPHNAIKSEPDYGEPSHLHTFFSMDFLGKHSEPYLQFDLPSHHNLLFPIQPVPDEAMMACDPVQDLSIGGSSSQISIISESQLNTEPASLPPPPTPPAPPPPPPPLQPEPEFESMNIDAEHVDGGLGDPHVIPDRESFRLPPNLVADVSADEIQQIKAIARIHDINYKSINFGEELIKEMVMSSVFKVPLSPSATMTAYRLMIQRVTKVAQGFDPFVNLQYKMQSTLLKHNADLIVSLRGAVFFEKRKGGLDQILISMGVDDLMAAKNMVMTALQTTELKRIDYQTFNSLQKVENSSIEARYNALLQRVGITVSFDADLVKMLSYVLLFSVNFDDTDPMVWRGVERVQEVMIGMMQRYIYAQYPRQIAVQLFSGLLHCVADLQELTWIKKQRQMAAQATVHIAAEDAPILTDANKPKHFKP